MRHVGHKSNFKCMHLPFLCLLSDATKESSPMPVLPAASLQQRYSKWKQGDTCKTHLFGLLWWSIGVRRTWHHYWIRCTGVLGGSVPWWPVAIEMLPLWKSWAMERERRKRRMRTVRQACGRRRRMFRLFPTRKADILWHGLSHWHHSRLS